MSDPRWNDPREDDARDLGDEVPHVYDIRDRDDRGPRDGLMRNLDLPRGDERNSSLTEIESTTLTAKIAARWPSSARFGSCRKHDLDLPHETLENVHDQRLVELVDLGESERGLTLTTEGRTCSIPTRLNETVSRPTPSTSASAAHAKSITTRISTRRFVRKKRVFETSILTSRFDASFSSKT